MDKERSKELQELIDLEPKNGCFTAPLDEESSQELMRELDAEEDAEEDASS